MNALIAKEIRLVLPAYGMALLLAIVPVWLLPKDPDNSSAVMAFFPFWLGAVMLALSSFGREFGLKTLALNLAQPFERVRIWRTKIAVLTAAMATVFCGWALSCAAKSNAEPAKLSWPETLAIGGMAAVVILAGGLWTTLLFRQVIAAFWFTVLIPGAILTAMVESGGSSRAIYIALGVYSVAGFLGARRQFLRAQETGWTGGIVAFPGLRAGDALRSAGRSRRPIAALLWKELQLHQISLAGIGLLFVLHLGVVALRKAGTDAFGGAIRTVLDFFCFLWLFVPLLVGGSSIAEERRLGTMEEHLCLPISSRIQFTIKLFFVVAIGGLLSASLLFVAEGIGIVAGATSGIIGIYFHSEGFTATNEFFFVLFSIILTLSMIGFYASTLARNVLQALAAGVVMAVVFAVLVMVASNEPAYAGRVLWRGNLVHFIAAPVFAFTVLWLAYRNFWYLSEDWRLWLRNILGLTTALACIIVSTGATYNRAWELFTRLEPPHGPARLALSQPARLATCYGREVLALLPDGRLWEDRFEFTDYASNRTVMSFGDLALFFHRSQNGPDDLTGVSLGGKWTGLIKHHFRDGSNWVDAAAGNRETVGIRSDGTLWVSEKPIRRILQNGKRTAEQLDRLVKVGAETNWLRVIREGGNASMLLLTRDGTLWSWGMNDFRGRQGWSGLQVFEPRRVGPESDWAEILASGEIGYAWKKDGRAWALGVPDGHSGYRGKEIAPGLWIERCEFLDKNKWRNVANCYPFEAGVREDGTLWVWSFFAWPSSDTGEDPSKQPVQIGKGTNWAAVTTDFSTVAALKADGSLWKWDLSYWRRGERRWPFAASPVRLGRHKDWIAVANTSSGLVSLAADGSLWNWWEADGLYPGQPWLAPSRKPVRVENIFEVEE